MLQRYLLTKSAKQAANTPESIISDLLEGACIKTSNCGMRYLVRTGKYIRTWGLVIMAGNTRVYLLWPSGLSYSLVFLGMENIMINIGSTLN